MVSSGPAPAQPSRAAPAAGRVEAARPATHEAILDATIEVASEVGLGRLSLEVVADRADVSRQTVYRYFGNREGLITAALLREEDVFIREIVDAVADEPDLRRALRSAVEAALRLAREHPLLDRLLAEEPETLLPIMLSGDGPVIPAARPVIAEMLRQRLPGHGEDEVARLADVCSRLIVSYAINPPDDDPSEVARLIAEAIAGGVAGS